MDAAEAELQPLLDDLGATHGPGLCALVADAGEVAFTGTVGTADLQQLSVPV